VTRAVEKAMERAPEQGSFTIVIRRSHHIACLAAYLKSVTDRGMLLLLASSDPNTESVAPFGGTRRLITPNPLAVGIPTGGDPILIDISMSATTNGMTARARAEKQIRRPSFRIRRAASCRSAEWIQVTRALRSA
jgi:L-lactate dehydrogenase